MASREHLQGPRDRTGTGAPFLAGQNLAPLPACPRSRGSLSGVRRSTPMYTIAPEAGVTVPITEMRKLRLGSIICARSQLKDLGALCCLSLMPQGF